MIRVWPGQSVIDTCTFTDEDGAKVDPTTVVVKKIAPNGTVTTYTYGVSAEVTRVSTGVYTLLVTTSTEGRYGTRWVGTEGSYSAVDESRIVAEDSPFV